MSEKKWALITGASSGIGLEFARIFAKNGDNVVVVARREDKLLSLKDELEEKYDIKVRVAAHDLTDREAPTHIHDELANDLEVEYLVNNAGYGGIGRFDQRPWEEDRGMIELNVLALAALTRLFLPAMVKRGHGRILNISSTASLTPGPYQAVYFATKAFVTSFSVGIAEELRGTGVTVTAALPGPTSSEFGAVSGLDKTPLFDKTVTPAEVAEAAYKAMMSGKREALTAVPWLQRIQLCLMPLAPESFVLRQVAAMQKPKK